MSSLRLYEVSDSQLRPLEPGDRDTLRSRLEASRFTVILLNPRDNFEFSEAVLDDDLGLHPLIVEDVLSTALVPPKVDRVRENRFVVLHYFDRMGEENTWQPEELNFISGPNFILLSHYRELPFGIQRRFPMAEAERKHTLEWSVLHFLLDVTVDSISAPVNDLDERVDLLEERFYEPETLFDYDPENFRRISRLRKQVLAVRRGCESNREVLNNLLREVQSDPDAPNLYFSDIYDHLVRYIQLAGNLRENITTLIELNINQLANRTNEIMRVLTVVGAIFLPLTFIAGIYGMNFQNMPELSLSWGYGAVWGLMLVVVGGMLYWFNRRGWL